MAEADETSHPDKNHKLSKVDVAFLALIILSFTLVFTYFSILRYENFFTYNWDLGINEQLLWTTTHGYLMFESGDFISYGTKSFLEVHSAYIAYPLAFLYEVFPTPELLFVIQSFVLAISSVPLYLIMRRHTDNRMIPYAVVLAYLTNFTIISALFFDFHWEVFIPVEFFSQYYLISERKFKLSLVPLLLGSATIEVYPLLSAALVLYFAYFDYGRKMFKISTMIKERKWVSYLLIFVASVVAYFMIRLLQTMIISPLVGNAASVSSFKGSVLDSFVPHIIPFSILLSTLYWIGLYSTFGYISFKKPKHVVMQIPWLVESILVNPGFSSYFGNQYAFIALPPVVIAFALSLTSLAKEGDRYEVVRFLFISFYLFLLSFSGYFLYLFLAARWPSSLSIIVLLLFPIIIFRTSLPRRVWKLLRSRFSISFLTKTTKPMLIVLAILFLVIFNFNVSPLNHANFQGTPMPGYQFSSSPNPEFHYAQIVSQSVPDNASVIASDNLFTLIANNANAYSAFWFPYNSSSAPYFPFNSTNLPKYVFADAAQYNLLPGFVTNAIENLSAYGLVYLVHGTSGYPGNIYLYELGYRGTVHKYNLT